METSEAPKVIQALGIPRGCPAELYGRPCSEDTTPSGCKSEGNQAKPALELACCQLAFLLLENARRLGKREKRQDPAQLSIL